MALSTDRLHFEILDLHRQTNALIQHGLSPRRSIPPEKCRGVPRIHPKATNRTALRDKENKKPSAPSRILDKTNFRRRTMVYRKGQKEEVGKMYYHPLPRFFENKTLSRTE
jgi:hypothetical protein